MDLPDNLKHHKDYRRCVHFHGIQKPCGAGIDPMTVRDTSGPGMAKWPCLTLPGREPAMTLCSSLRLMTREELDAETAAFAAAFDKFEADLKAGNCPHCGRKMESRKRSGRCEYAEPCGHRLGQVGDDSDAPTLPESR